MNTRFWTQRSLDCKKNENLTMADWDENENAYNADPKKYLENLEAELTQQSKGSYDFE